MADYDADEAAAIAALCTDCGVPHMAASLLAEGVSLDVAKTRISIVGTAMEIMAIARRKDPSIPAGLATDMLAQGKNIEQIRTALFEYIVAAEDAVGEINSHTPLPMSEADHQRTASRASMERELRAKGLEPVSRTGR
ncbi:MAG: hypothetical protein PGN25_05705 [Methylorubrum populi]